MAQPTEAAAFVMHPLKQVVAEPAAMADETKRENRGRAVASLNIIIVVSKSEETCCITERFVAIGLSCGDEGDRRFLGGLYTFLNI